MNMECQSKSTGMMMVPSSACIDDTRGTAKVGNPTTTLLAIHLAFLLEVIRSRRWSSFEKIVLSKPNVLLTIIHAVTMHEEFEGASLLHAMLRRDPPIAIVAKMMAMLPEPDRTAALRARDPRGRTPLHIAAAQTTAPTIVKLLGHADPMTCVLTDEDGRTPLHLACSVETLLDGDERECERDHAVQTTRRRKRDPATRYHVVRALLSESLAASLMEDGDGMSALEIAIISGTSIDVVSLLQNASMTLLQQRENERRTSSEKRESVEGGRSNNKRRLHNATRDAASTFDEINQWSAAF